ncbi:MAG: hypothetical protein RI932_598, partial [Pseudomonadota bacterium]
MVEMLGIEPGSEKETALGNQMLLPLIKADTQFKRYGMVRNGAKFVLRFFIFVCQRRDPSAIGRSA